MIFRRVLFPPTYRGSFTLKTSIKGPPLRSPQLIEGGPKFRETHRLNSSSDLPFAYRYSLSEMTHSGHVNLALALLFLFLLVLAPFSAPFSSGLLPPHGSPAYVQTPRPERRALFVLWLSIHLSLLLLVPLLPFRLLLFCLPPQKMLRLYLQALG